MRYKLNFRKGFYFIAVSLILIFAISFITISIVSNNFETPEEKAIKISGKCQNSNQWNDCYSQAFSDTLTLDSIDTTRAVLRELQSLDPKTNDCHYIAHKIAWKAVTLNPGKPFEILKYVDSDECAGGFIHGSIEGLRQSDSNFILSADKVDQVCNNIQKQNSSFGSHEACTHAFGHIILVEFNADIDQAISFCKRLQNEDQYNCFTGVFMESITRENLSAHSVLPALPWNSTTTGRQISICNNYDGKITEACWEEISHMLVIGRKYDLKKSYAPCELAKSHEAKKTCIIHTSQLLISSPHIEEDQIPHLCKTLLDHQDYNSCLEATVTAALQTSNFDPSSNKIKLLCSSQDLEKKCGKWIDN